MLVSYQKPFPGRWGILSRQIKMWAEFKSSREHTIHVTYWVVVQVVVRSKGGLAEPLRSVQSRYDNNNNRNHKTSSNEAYYLENLRN